jgi:hypothetical protein
MEDQDKKAQFLPFHAINEFMRDDYRLEVIRTALIALPSLPDANQSLVNRMTRKFVTVPGFRNSTKAPTLLRSKASTEVFEKNPQFVAAILSAWAEAHPDLRRHVYDLLVERGWEIFPVEADRTKLPGFMVTWPQGENFEMINIAFTEKYPGHSQPNSDDISLMVVWLSARLPYHTTPGEETDQ